MRNEHADEPESRITFPGKWLQHRFWRHHHVTALIQFFGAVMVLAALNWLLARGDAGWLKLNPSPWIFLPIFMGFSRGYLWGVGAGLFLVILRLVLKSPEEALTGADFYLLWSTVLVGAVGGLIRGIIGRRQSQTEAQLERTQSLCGELREQVALLKHNEQDLSLALVAQGLEPSGIALGLQEVVEQFEGAERDEAFLNLIRDFCGVGSAAIYHSGKGGRCVRMAQLQSDGAFPEILEKTPMFEQAEITGKIATQRWFWEKSTQVRGGGEDDHFLAAMAHPADKEFRILVVSRMHFDQINWENLWKLESAFRWYENNASGRATDLSVLVPMLDSAASPEPAPAAERRPAPKVGHSAAAVPANQVAMNREVVPAGSAAPNGAPNGKAPKQVPGDPVVLGKPILDAPGFKLRLGQCRQIQEQMGLEHRLVIFVPGESESKERCEEFARSLSVTMPSTDDLAVIPSDGGRLVYGLLTEAPTSEAAEEHAGSLLASLPELDLRFFVLRLNDKALSAFET